MTWHGAFTGYEFEAVRGAEAILNGSFEFKRIGISMVLMYLPFVLLQKIFSIENTNFLTLVIIFYSALTNSVIFLLLKKLFKNIYSSLLVSALIAVGSMVWPYANIGMEYQATLFLALTLLALISYEETEKNIFWVGASLGLLITAKAYDILLFIPIMIYLFWILKEKKQVKQIFNPVFLANLLLPAFILFSSTIIYNLFVYQTFTGDYSSAISDGLFKIDIWWEGFYGYFFSAGKSIFLFNPLLIISIFYWPKFFKEYKKIAWFIILSLLMLLVINAPFRYWTEEVWGPRKLMPIVPLLHLPLIYFIIRLKKKIFTIILIAVSLIAIYVQLLGATYFYGTQLNFLRNSELSSMQSMIYNPTLSHPILYHKFFMSYLTRLTTGQSKNFYYYQADWSAWKMMKISGNIPFEETRIDLQQYEEPSILWIRKNNLYGKIFFAFDIILTLSLLYFIMHSFKKRTSE